MIIIDPKSGVYGNIAVLNCRYYLHKGYPIAIFYTTE